MPVQPPVVQAPATDPSLGVLALMAVMFRPTDASVQLTLVAAAAPVLVMVTV